MTLEDAIEAAKKAVQYDQSGQIEPSIYYYETAAKLLEKIAVQEPEKAVGLTAKIEEYRKRARELSESNNRDLVIGENASKEKQQKGYFLLQEAIEEDETGDREDAIEFYAKAIEFISQNPDLMQGELKQLALQALERAEILKGIKPVKTVRETLHRGNSAHLQVTMTDSYSEEEKAVLMHTSTINHNNYVPFMSVDLKERFQYSIPFTDKSGELALAPKQKRDFSRWVRPQDLCSDPCIVDGVPNYLAIKQTVISDCSFVASLAVAASYEQRFNRKLVTSIIYPQSKNKQPRYNPFGKYMIKLHINGVTRKIIIDDYLPINRYGQLLCSYSANKNEFWVSLLEKAYMKVMGGYDFPGSNSNIDLHALTGWIPERCAIRKEPDFNKDALFSTLETRLAKGDVLVTVATGEMPEIEAERSGLVPTHAYALIDVQTVNNVRLLKLKNPWSHLRWRGRYSELDTRNWTLELQKILNYDPNSAAQFDNGVFWIDFDSVCAFFDVFYMNWNPELFQYTYCIHQSWHAGIGPVKDLYTVSSNPQFSLDVSSTSGAVWLLLTRHITDIDDFRENKEYITVFVYKNNGKRVYYPYDPAPYIDGVKINSPHYLCKIILTPNSGRKFTIVISQYEKSATIYYTLRAYATCPFSLTKIGDPYRYEKQITDKWEDFTAGGCPNHPLTYKNNPRFRLDLEGTSENYVLIELKGPKQYQLGVEVVILKVNDEGVTAPFRSKSSGAYRSGYVILELENIPSGVLHIIPSTFLPNQEGPFIILVKSSALIQLSKV